MLLAQAAFLALDRLAKADAKHGERLRLENLAALEGSLKAVGLPGGACVPGPEPACEPPEDPGSGQVGAPEQRDAARLLRGLERALHDPVTMLSRVCTPAAACRTMAWVVQEGRQGAASGRVQALSPWLSQVPGAAAGALEAGPPCRLPAGAFCSCPWPSCRGLCWHRGCKPL